ncbi:MAG: class I SAM-dependent methyltransferase, partial [Acidimicrobiales bacterium]
MAELYDEMRPSYPSELIEDIFCYTALPPEGRILEAGAGTGKATAVVAAHLAETSRTLVCVEPDSSMGSVWRRNLGHVPAARLVESSFEDYVESLPADARFDLLIAAQAWHWIE